MTLHRYGGSTLMFLRVGPERRKIGLLKSIAHNISTHPFCEGMSSAHLPLLTEATSLIRVEADNLIFDQGEDASFFYLLETGRITLESRVAGRGTVNIQTIREGDALGWSWLFPPYRWHFSARAITRVDLIAFDASTLRCQTRKHPEFGRDLIHRVAAVMLQRLQNTRIQLLNRTVGDME